MALSIAISNVVESVASSCQLLAVSQPSTRRQLPLLHHGRPQLGLWQLALELQAYSACDLFDRVRFRDEVVVAHVEPEYRAAPETLDPIVITLVQRGPVVGRGVFFFRASTRRDALRDDVERTVEIDQESWRTRGGRVQQLGIQTAIQRPLVRRHQALLEQA